MKKAVIGLNIKYFYQSIAFGILGFICLFLPYINGDSIQKSLFGMVGEHWLITIAIVFTICTMALSAINLIRPSKRGYQIWQYVQSVNTALWTLLTDRPLP